MASPDSIPPFPDNIDRSFFGAYLAGFTDGEGCFTLRFQGKVYNKKTRRWYYTKRPCASFIIGLRNDDEAILRRIQSFLGCGHIRTGKRKGENRVITYIVTKAIDLAQTIVPTFISYPLQAKKAKDFAIWSQGIKLLENVYYRHVQGTTQIRGVLRKWTEEEIDEFGTLIDALRTSRSYKATRAYNAPVLPLPISPPPRPEPTLFDGIPSEE